MATRKVCSAVVIILVIAVLAVCIFPIAQGVERTAEGMTFTDEAMLKETVIAIKGHKLNYLIRKDKFQATKTISDYAADIQTTGPLYSMKNGYYLTSISCYDYEKNCYVGGYLVFDETFSVVLRRYGAGCRVCGIDRQGNKL